MNKELTLEERFLKNRNLPSILFVVDENNSGDRGRYVVLSDLLKEYAEQYKLGCSCNCNHPKLCSEIGVCVSTGKN